MTDATAPAAGILFPLAGRRVWVAGHRGMVGAALCRRLARADCEILTAGRDDLDLTDQAAVDMWLSKFRPEAIFVAAARVGGILANDTHPAAFLRDNLAIATNVIHAAYRSGVAKLMFLGSSCIYPRLAPQPMPEEALLTGPLEPTNEWYAIAKIAGLKMCAAYRREYGCDFISAQPTNLYGIGDNFDLASSHVIPALMAKAHRAKLDSAAELRVWGSGRPLREFLYVDDLADALVFLMERYSDELHVNVGSGEEVSIADLARAVADAVGFAGWLQFDASKPDGMPRKLLDTSRLQSLGWRARTPLVDGLRATYAWYRDSLDERT
jgi:GDP-L-fucose synthase